jgi:YVTN family beta-propeller protein
MKHTFSIMTFGVTIALALVAQAHADAVIATVPTGLAPTAIAIDSVTNMIYVANGGSNSVTVINGSTNATTTINVGEYPNAIAVNPVTNMIYVANRASNSVTAINGSTNATTTINVEEAPEAIAVNPVTNIIYVANTFSNSVTAINGSTNATTTINVGGGPMAIAVNPLTNLIYVENGDSNSVTVINGSTNATTAIAVGADPAGIAVNPATNMIYVANAVSNSVTAINGSTNATTVIALGAVSGWIAVNPATNMIYVAYSFGDSVTAINGSTNAMAAVDVGGAPGEMMVNSMANLIYVMNQESNYVTVINGLTNQPSALLVVGLSPVAIADNLLTGRIYVVNHYSSSVSVISGSGIPGNLNATIYDSTTSATVSGATVQIFQTSISQTTNSSGLATFNNLPVGNYSFAITAPGYFSKTGLSVNILSGQTTNVGWLLTPLTIPANPKLVSPANAATNVLIASTLTWNSVPGAASYRIQASSSSGFASTIFDQGGLTAAQITASGMPNSAVIYWHVNATNSLGTGGWSSIWSFTTAPPVPPAPLLLLPTNGAPGISPAPSLSWNQSSGASSYDILVSTSLNFANTIFSLGLTATSATISALSYATTYYWRVNAMNITGASGWSITWSFTTLSLSIPDTPILVSPANGAAGISTLATFAWATVAGAASYRLQVSNSSVFSLILIDQSGIPGTSLKTSTLPTSTKIYWHVNATNNLGTSAWSTTWSATTGTGATLSDPAERSSCQLSVSPTGIRYLLSSPSSVSIVLYDMRGRRAKSLSFGMQEAGPYEVNFKHSNMTAGTYAVEFRAGAIVVQRKVAIIN